MKTKQRLKLSVDVAKDSDPSAPSKRHRTILLCIIALSTLLRVYQFPAIPAGLNFDEASAGYETYALIAHGTDRWGNKWPVYFPGWGSGQNVLLSYLNMPFIKLLGLSVFSVRLLPMLLGILSTIVVYLAVKKIYNVKTALVASFLLGTIPWHIMMSRWSLESNILPFFLLLGTWLLVSCYTSKYQARLIPFSLIGLAFAFYAYGVSIVITPWIVLLFWIFNIKTIWHYKISFLLSIIVFLIIAAPFFLFVLDNYVLHATPIFVKSLPFSVPLLPTGRLDQVKGQNPLQDNLLFLANSFNDGLIWNVMDPFLPLGLLTSPLALIAGIYFSLRHRVRSKSVFVFWFVASLPPLFLYDLNVNRINAIFIPIIVLSAVGISEIYDAIRDQSGRIALILVLAGITLYNGIFCINYFHLYNAKISSSFHANFDSALDYARSVTQKNELVYVSSSYLYTLFYLKADPSDFRSHAAIYLNQDGVYVVENYRNYIFDHNLKVLAMVPSYIALLHDYETISCKHQQLLYNVDQWKIERCFNR